MSLTMSEPMHRRSLAELAAESPVLLWDPDIVTARYRSLREALPGFDIRYAVKANPAPQVLRTLSELGAGFDIASAPELALVERLVRTPEAIMYSNPVKPAGHIRAARASGVSQFAFDSEPELCKLATHAPASRVYVRLAVDDTASVFPLSRKFGVGIDEAQRLLLLAGQLGLEPYGVTFHVGSQCLDPTAWARAIGNCGKLMRRLQEFGIRLRMLDIGGGFPAPYADPVPGLAEIAAHIEAAVAALPYRPPVLVTEPGRYLVAESAVLAATVLLVEERADGRWVFLDVSGYHGLMEALQTGGQWRFPIWTSADDRPGPQVLCTVTGPSCDSSDTMFFDLPLPAALDEGDRVFIGSAGAYSISYASHFNGFPPPRIVAGHSSLA